MQISDNSGGKLGKCIGLYSKRKATLLFYCFNY